MTSENAATASALLRRYIEAGDSQDYSTLSWSQRLTSAPTHPAASRPSGPMPRLLRGVPRTRGSTGCAMKFDTL